MFYSIINSFDVFSGEYTPERKVYIGGSKSEYVAVDANNKITNLFSTDPSRYLDKRYLPGTKY